MTSWSQSARTCPVLGLTVPCPEKPLGQFSSVPQLCLTLATPWTTACQASLSIANFRSLLTLMSIISVMPSNHLILYHPLLLLPSIFPSIRVFSSESVLHIRWPKYWCFSFSISPSNEYSGLISFRIVWLDLLAVQGTQESPPHHIPWRPDAKADRAPPALDKGRGWTRALAPQLCGSKCE